MWGLWQMDGSTGRNDTQDVLDTVLSEIAPLYGERDLLALGYDVDTFVGTLGDWRVTVKEAAAVLSRIGAPAARTDILNSLHELLRDSEGFVREAVVKALGEIGLPAARKDILDRLLELLGDPQENVRELTAETLGNMASAAAGHERIVNRLQGLFGEGWSPAAKALARMGSAGIRVFRVSGTTVVKRAAELAAC